MKRIALFGVGFLSCLSLSACGSLSVQEADKVAEKAEEVAKVAEIEDSESMTVLDGDGTTVLETENQDTLDAFSEYVTNEIEEIDSPYAVFDSPPKDADVDYHYILKTKSGDEIHFYLYQGEEDIYIEDIPLIGSIKLPLAESERNWLETPEKWE